MLVVQVVYLEPFFELLKFRRSVFVVCLFMSRSNPCAVFIFIFEQLETSYAFTDDVCARAHENLQLQHEKKVGEGGRLLGHGAP
jgi:hypothetical protein